MIQIQLQRTRRKGKAIVGKMTIPFSHFPVAEDEQDATVATLENADYIIPAGTYHLVRTFSPKFKKQLPLLEDVPDREGIRIHRGSIPEHSKGCILVDMQGAALLDIVFNRINTFYEDEEVSICITDDFGADSGSGC